MIETLLGGILGGVFRAVPEVLKYFDAKHERAHELAMQSKMYDFQKLLGSQKIEELSIKGQTEFNASAMEALTEAIKAQAAPSGVRWIDGFSSLMRPLITLQWVVLLYPAVIIASYILAIDSGIPPLVAVVETFGPGERALVAGILNFWFLGRVFDRVR